MYFMCCNQDKDKSSELHHYIKYLLSHDMPSEDMGSIAFHEDMSKPPPQKKRKHSSRIVSVTRRAILAQVGENGKNIEEELNCANPHRTLYTTFKEQLVTLGVIKWRLHEYSKDICVMNDINPSTGLLIPQSFVHVTCLSNIGVEPVIKCSCGIFNLIQRAGHQEVHLWPGEELIPDSTLTCMHCRFYRDYLLNAHQDIYNEDTPLTRPISMVKDSLEEMENEVQLIGNVILPAATKFSVKGFDSYSVVNVSFRHEKCFAICTDGICSAHMKNKRNVDRDEGKNCNKINKIKCSHLTTFFNNMDYVQAFFPGFFNKEQQFEEDQNEIQYQHTDEEQNYEDTNIGKAVSGHFNMDTGLWEYKSLSQHKPKEMYDPLLVNNTQQRNDFIRSGNLDSTTGLYSHFILSPKHVDSRLRDKICQCGIPFSNEDQYKIEQGAGTLFTRNGPVAVKYYNLQCTQKVCQIDYRIAAQEQNIHLFTKNTCAGDEIGWDFVQQVMRTKCSFSAFCNEMTRKYQTTNIMSGPFMSPNTFIQWFFGWIAAFKIDFRKEIDPWCKYSPKMLACDGTHIGVSLRHMKLDKPVTTADRSDRILPSLHQRNDRALLKDTARRKHLRYLVKKFLKKKFKKKEMLNTEEEVFETAMLNDYIESECHEPVKLFLLEFLHPTQHPEFVQCMARLLYMMSGDAALCTILPFMCHDLVQDTCKEFSQNITSEEKLEAIKKFCIEVAQILQLGKKHGCSSLSVNFIDFVVRRIQKDHEFEEDRGLPEVEVMENTYNPSLGTCYYFTEHGNQLRKMPSYKVSGKVDESSKYDEEPQIDQCRKFFPKVSFGGFGYLFLWFCPVHGHSYGFHIIAGGEGRKDAFASLYKYLEEPPEHIFYDFACQLSEYCLNREPLLFRNTRFWHDLFHSIGHLCGINFKSGRVQGLEGVNTEICEQVNSFLQCIKYTASHLSQDHFIFFLQFFLYLMNKDKTQKSTLGGNSFVNRPVLLLLGSCKLLLQII